MFDWTALLKWLLTALLGLLGLAGCCVCIQPTHKLAWERTEQLGPIATPAATLEGLADSEDLE